MKAVKYVNIALCLMFMALAASHQTAKADISSLPAGPYLVGCHGGVNGIWSLYTGQLVVILDGGCCDDCEGKLRKFWVLSSVSNPPAPYLTMATNSVWLGLTASQWVAKTNAGTPYTGTSTAYNLTSTEVSTYYSATLPELYANEAHFGTGTYSIH